MRHDLGKARLLAESVRFSGDQVRQSAFSDPSQTREFANLNYQNGLRISTETTPRAASQLDIVFGRLDIPSSVVEAFVFPSSDIVADCFSGSASECVIRFSSQLIERLEGDEFCFVAGHEIGHFLLEHGLSGEKQGELSPGYFMRLRSQEISADRLGLIACGSLESAMQALMKTVSGLSDYHLKFDVGTFIAQLKRSSAKVQEEQWSTSHPSLVFRSRALLWFSMSEHFIGDSSKYPIGCLDDVDRHITRDLERFVDGPVRRRMEQARKDLSIWTAVMDIVDAGSFTRQDQGKFAEMFGEDTLRQLKQFLSSLGKDEIEEVVCGKLQMARENLQEMIPAGFANELETIRQRITEKLH